MSFILSAIGVLEYLRVHKFAMPSSRFAYFLRARLSVECGNSSTKLLLSRDLKHCNRCSSFRHRQVHRMRTLCTRALLRDSFARREDGTPKAPASE